MNNNASWFSATEAGPGNNIVLNKITWAVDNDLDPIDFWREHQISNDQEMSVEDMADILACEPAVYKMHVASYYKHPYSPLTGEHVLNFCKHVKVHPADLISSDLSPVCSIPPHIYEALQIVARTAPNRDDRALAHAHIGFEKNRYANFVYSNPEIADHFINMQRHVQAFNDPEPWHKALNRSVRAIGSDDIRLTLRRAFAKERIAYDFYDGKNHAEDFHLVQRNALADKETRVQFRQKKNKEHGGVIWQKAVLMYGGIKQGEKVLDFIDKKLATFDLCNFTPDKTVKRLTAMIKGLYPLNDYTAAILKGEFGAAAGMDDPIRMLCASVFSYRRNLQNADLSVTLLRSDLQELKAFEEWQKSTQQPEFFYMNYLYCNHVASRKAALPTEQKQEQPQMARLG